MIKPVSRRPSFKADMQPVLSARQSLDRPLDRRLFSTSPRNSTARPAPFRDRNCVPLLGDIESHKGFATLSHGPPSVHEARLGPPEQPSFLPARKGGPPPQPPNMASIRSLPTTRRRPPRASTIRLPRRHRGRSRDGRKPVGPRRAGESGSESPRSSDEPPEASMKASKASEAEDGLAEHSAITVATSAARGAVLLKRAHAMRRNECANAEPAAASMAHRYLYSHSAPTPALDPPLASTPA